MLLLLFYQHGKPWSFVYDYDDYDYDACHEKSTKFTVSAPFSCFSIDKLNLNVSFHVNSSWV